MRKNKSVDLLFLDIELVSTDGIQIGRQIRHELEDQDVSIAYISSKSSYALELFKIHPIDFLIKPINAQDVYDTIDEALRLYNRNNTVFEYRANGYSCKIPYRDIHYFYSENKKDQHGHGGVCHTVYRKDQRPGRRAAGELHTDTSVVYHQHEPHE